jgi:hypothetical protein
MADTWASLAKLALEQHRYLIGAAVVGSVAFFAKKYGLIDDLSPLYYYFAVGAGLFAIVVLVATVAEASLKRLSTFTKNIKAKRTRAAFAVKNVLTAGDHDKHILLFYKERNQRRFRAVGANGHFSGMVQQALLDRDSADQTAFVQHFVIPDVIWRLMDNPPAGWDPKSRIAAAPWE